MIDLIRSSCLTNYAEVARSVGIEPAKMLRKFRLPPACLDDQDMRVAVGSVRRLLEASAAAAGIRTSPCEWLSAPASQLLGL